jgi:hypothetical protein
MIHQPQEHPDTELVLVRALLETNAAIVGDVAQISDNTWAIHGVIAVDGAVIMAEFTSYDEARTVLDQLPMARHDPLPPDQAFRPIRRSPPRWPGASGSGGGHPGRERGGHRA